MKAFGCLVVGVAMFVLGFQTLGRAQTDDELLQDLRREVREFGQDADADFGSSLTLVLLESKAYPVLLEALEDSDPAVRANAATMLAWVPQENNPTPAEVLEALRRAALDSDPRARESAESALRFLESPTQ